METVPVARNTGKDTEPLLTLQASFQPDRDAKKGAAGEKAYEAEP
jgi:hypothetical protein